MNAAKLFHVLVIAGGALGVGCASASPEPPTTRSDGSSQSGGGTIAANTKADGGTDAEATPSPTPDSGDNGSSGGAPFW